MSWFKRLFSVGVNSVNDTMTNVTDQLVDIKREGNALVSKLERDIGSLHSRIVDAQKEVQLSKYKIKENKGFIVKHTQVAELAVKQGNDEDAVQALSRVEGLELISNTHQQTVDILQPIIDQQIQHVNKMQSEKQLLKAEITRLDLEEKAYKMKAQLLGSDGGVQGVDLNYLRDRVNKARATCEAKEIVNSQIHTEHMEVSNTSPTSSSVQDRLEALKASVKQSELM